MLVSTRLSEQITKLTEKLRSDRFAIMTGQEDDFAQRQGEVRAMYDQLTELDKDRNTAWGDEAEEATRALAKVVEGGEDRMTPELKELREVAKKVGLNDYMMAARDGRPVSGAGAEYNTHVFGHNAAGDFPIEMLGDREKVLDLDVGDWRDIKESEHRTALTGTGVNPGSSTNYIAQLFANSEAAFCGASFPAVGVGDHSYPIFSKSTTAGNFARAAAEPTPAGSLTINTAVNRRLQSTMEITGEDENRIPNIAGGLVAHLRGGLQETLDNYAIDQLVAGASTGPSVTTTTETLAMFLSRIGNLVDGRGAFNVGDVRVLLGTVPKSVGAPTPFSLLAGSSIGTDGSHFSELPRLSEPNFVRGSAHLAAVTSADDGPILFTRIGPNVNLGRFQVPIWRRGQMLRDTGVGQLSGIIRYTVAMYAAVEITAQDQHRYDLIEVA